MKKIICFIISFLICSLLKTQHIWIVLAPVYFIMLFFRLDNHLVWEIPLACLACSVFETAFGDDIISLLRIMIPTSAALIGFISPKRLFAFFPVAVCALFFKNIYAVAAIWATLWCIARSLVTKPHSTTKFTVLQEYKS